MRIRMMLLCLLVVAFAACGGEEYVPRTTTQTPKPPQVTGILLNAQQMEKNVDAAERKVLHWEVVDDAGVPLMSSDQIGPEFKKGKGVMYSWKRQQAIDEGRPLHLGRNYVEIRIREVKISGEGTDKKATFVASSDGASTLRGLPNLSELVRQANIVILVGKMGD